MNVLCLVTQLCLTVTPWTVSHQAPLSLGILQSRILEWVATPFSRGREALAVCTPPAPKPSARTPGS